MKILDIFAPSSGLGVGPEFPDLVECPFPDCGAPCKRSDISDEGACRYCGGYIAAWLRIPVKQLEAKQ